MKKILLFLGILTISQQALSQDAAVTGINAPVTGCALSASESVTIRIFNFGTDINGAFDVSYVVNGGTPVTETITPMTPILQNSTYIYTFTTPVDLSVPGTYTIDAYTSLPGDINPSNDAFNGYSVTSVASSVGGSIAGAALV